MSLAALPILLADEAIRFAKDLGSSVSSLFGGVAEDSPVDLYTKQDALSQIITLAVLADGEVTDAEAANLRHLFETSDRFTGDAGDAVTRLREAAKRASDLEALENTVRVVATDLDREWKDDAFRFVAVLALRGSGFGRQEQGFRAAPSSDPGTLLAIFARALDVPPDERDSVIEHT
ncbi:MAG: hypothetical protein R3B82_18945, partial [Sandaracinaceae bacterium]